MVCLQLLYGGFTVIRQVGKGKDFHRRHYADLHWKNRLRVGGSVPMVGSKDPSAWVRLERSKQKLFEDLVGHAGWGVPVVDT